MAISEAHVIVYSRDAEADRSFLRDVLKYPYVDAGGGWLMMCDDLDTTMAELAAAGVICAAVTEARWGRLSRFQLPGGSEVGIYEPRHPLATGL